MSTLLETINGPKDLTALSIEQLNQLADEMRHFITHSVSQTGGHLASTLEFKPASFKWAQAGAEILLDGKVLDIAGLLKPDTATQFDLDKQAVTAAELNFDLLLTKAGAIPAAKPVPRFPVIVRDLSLIVDEPVEWSQITSVIQSKAPADLEAIDFSGMYRGKPIPNGKKSITVSMRFRNEQGTLRHETVDSFQNAILTGLANTLGAELRTA